MAKEKAMEYLRNATLVFAGVVLIWTRALKLQNGMIEPHDFGLAILFLMLLYGYVKRNYPHILHR